MTRGKIYHSRRRPFGGCHGNSYPSRGRGLGSRNYTSKPHLNVKRESFGEVSLWLARDGLIFSGKSRSLEAKFCLFLKKMGGRCLILVSVLFLAFVLPVLSLDKCTQVSSKISSAWQIFAPLAVFPEYWAAISESYIYTRYISVSTTLFCVLIFLLLRCFRTN